MKQIIVNVSGLTNEEKQRVNEALAKIKNIRMCNPKHWDKTAVMYGPSVDSIMVGFDYYEDSNQTHTPQQVLEMAGMAPSDDQHVFLADMLIITDSSGNIVYDSTLDVANPGKGGALPDSGASVKSDENGVAVMTTKRKVRKDFDPGKEYTVDVLECTEAEKKEVQQAFFDAGFKWEIHGEVYKYIDAAQYTNTMYGGRVTANLMYGNSVEGGNMTAKEFLDIVYEPEKKGHVHAELMAQYAEDAKTSKTPWQLWEYLDKDDGWTTFRGAPGWYETSEYRRKPKTKMVHGVEIPVFEFTPKVGEKYYAANVVLTEFFEQWGRSSEDCTFTQRMVERGLIYPYTEEGRQAAILHAKAMLGMVQE